MKRFKLSNREQQLRFQALVGILNMQERAWAKGKRCRLNGVHRGWNMLGWDCNSACCALGSCMYHPWFKERGLHRHKGAAEPEYQGHCGYEAGAEFFGITNVESVGLFAPGSYPDSTITPADVRARVFTLAAGYKQRRAA